MSFFTKAKAKAKANSNLTDQQAMALENALRYQHSLLIGYAGTGKTFTAKAILERLSKEYEETNLGFEHLALPQAHFPIAICAYTGMAVSVLKDHTGNEWAPYCYTIHKLINYAPELIETKPSKADIANGADPLVPIIKKIFTPHRNKACQLTGLRFLIVDEISMIPPNLWQELMDAIPSDCKILCIGDLAQLPPVMGSSIMPELAAEWPTVELTKVFRTKVSLIINNAHAIRQGKAPEKGEDFQILGISAKAHLAQQQIINFFNNAQDYDHEQDIILTPLNGTPVGQEQLNQLLRKINNPSAKVRIVKTMRNTKRFAIGDRVMTTKNDADLGIFNGQLGKIVSIVRNAQSGFIADEDHSSENLSISFDTTAISAFSTDEDGTSERLASHSIEVLFDNGETISFSTSNQIENLQLAWAITVHKAQGSGFRHVYIILHNAHARLLNNEILYTAVTRAREKVTILATSYAIKKAITNQLIKGATLEEKLAAFQKKNAPNLTAQKSIAFGKSN